MPIDPQTGLMIAENIYSKAKETEAESNNAAYLKALARYNRNQNDENNAALRKAALMRAVGAKDVFRPKEQELAPQAINYETSYVTDALKDYAKGGGNPVTGYISAIGGLIQSLTGQR